MSIVLSNMLERESLVLSSEISDSVKMTNEINAVVLMYPANTASQWILKTGFWNDAGVWDDTAKWKDES